MNRNGDGLVRRVKTREDGSNANSSGNSPEDRDSQDNKDLEDYGDDGDSKETRLTLMEEVLLLGLKDKEVSFSYRKFPKSSHQRNFHDPEILLAQMLI